MSSLVGAFARRMVVARTHPVHCLWRAARIWGRRRHSEDDVRPIWLPSRTQRLDMPMPGDGGDQGRGGVVYAHRFRSRLPGSPSSARSDPKYAKSRATAAHTDHNSAAHAFAHADAKIPIGPSVRCKRI